MDTIFHITCHFTSRRVTGTTEVEQKGIQFPHIHVIVIGLISFLCIKFYEQKPHIHWCTVAHTCALCDASLDTQLPLLVGLYHLSTFSRFDFFPHSELHFSSMVVALPRKGVVCTLLCPVNVYGLLDIYK